MTAAKKLLNSPHFFWALLALPSFQMILTLIADSGGRRGPSQEILEGSGVLATFLLIIAMSLSPLHTIFSKSRVAAWLLQRRRYIGVAVFSYSLVHLAFYFVDWGSLQVVMEELTTPIILTGWLALFIFIPMAVTSNAIMTQAMGWRRWKMLQRGVYPAAILVMAHWLIVEPELGSVIFFAVLGALEFCRLWLTLSNRKFGKELHQHAEA